MNRMDEYRSLLEELEKTPPALEYTINRVKLKEKKINRIKKIFTISSGTMVIFIIAFIIMINISTEFAMACIRIPIIREFANVIAFSPSLKAAVENEYIQLVNLEQTDNDITMKIEYLIVDDKQINIFYTINTTIGVNPSIKNMDGSDLKDYILTLNEFTEIENELQKITIDFHESTPDEFILNCTVGEKLNLKGNPIASFSFKLNVNKDLIAKSKIIELNKDFIIDDQNLTVKTVEIYPTHIRINIDAAEHNTSWLKSLKLYAENEKGIKFETPSSGISAVSSGNSKMMASYRLESPYFSNTKNLKLFITGADFLDKNVEKIKIDLINNTTDPLPEGTKFLGALKENNNWNLTFSAKYLSENTQYQIFESRYYDENGKDYEYNNWSSTIALIDKETNKIIETPNSFYNQFTLKNYHYDTVYLVPNFTKKIILDDAIVIKIK